MPIQHSWDDWDPYEIVGNSTISTEQLLSRISHNAKLIYSLGCAEWVLARFGQHDRSTEARHYLDACWAYEISDDYELPEELEDEEWTGPVLGPICLSLTTVLNTMYGFDEDNAEIDAAFAEKIALHVIPDHDVFMIWRNAVLTRLLEICPIDIEDLEGSRLPREILDPKIEIKVNEFSSLLQKTQSELQLKNNKFVHLVDE
jgi:hypothetical protein